MTAGIDAIGLALAIFPIIVEIVDCYKGSVTGRDVRHLSESLKNYERIFFNSVESLLRSAVSPVELRTLLGNLEGDCWKSDVIGNKIIGHFGPDAKDLLDTVHGIHKMVLILKSKLPPISANGNSDLTKLSRAKQVVQCFVRGPAHKVNLERLKSRVVEFRILVDDAVKLAPTRRRPSTRLRDLKIKQERANGLYNALRNSWHCDCEHPHPANMRLDVWSTDHGTQNSKPDLDFSFLFADDAESAPPEHWMTVKVSPLNVRPVIQEQSISGSEDFCSSPISIQSQTPGLQSISRSISKVSFQIHTTATDSEAQPSTEATGDLIRDLCAILHDIPRPHRRVGSISDSDGNNYGLFSAHITSGRKPRQSSMTMADALRQSTRSTLEPEITRQRSIKIDFNPKDRIRLGLRLAWGVLQFSSTEWLRGNWTKENILLVLDSSNGPEPYVSHGFCSYRTNSDAMYSPTLKPRSTTEAKGWVKNETLFALAVFLIEMCYNKSIEELAQDQDKDRNHEPSAFTRFLTASRLSHDVQNWLGLRYAEAVKACLHCNIPDMPGQSQVSTELPENILDQIIGPLQKAAEAFGTINPEIAVY